MTSFNSYVKLPEGMFWMFFSHTFHPLPTAGLVVATWSVAEPPELQHQAGRSFFKFIARNEAMKVTLTWEDHGYIYIYSHTCICIHVYIYMHIHIYTCTHIHMHVHIHIYIYVHIYTYTYTYIHTHIYIHRWSENWGSNGKINFN